MSLDFAAINREALNRYPVLLEQLLPGGVVRGNEYVCASLNGGAGESCSVNLTTGKWAEFAGNEKGGDCISLWAAARGVNQGEAARELAEELGMRLSSSFASRKRRNPEDLVPVMPATAEITARVFQHKDRGKPASKWEYRDTQGKILGYACRFEIPDGNGGVRKDVIPLTCWTYPDGKPFWRWKAFADPRPLYGLDRLVKADQDAPVLLAEGEKTADAAKLIFPDVAVLSWPGGCKAVGKCDLTPLAGRRILLWPDADAPGVIAMLKLHKRLSELEGVTVLFVPPPEGVDEGWDVADAPEDAWSDLRERLVKQAVDADAFAAIAEERFGVKAKEIPTEDEDDAPAEISPQLAAAKRAAIRIGPENILFSQSAFWMWNKRCWRKTEDVEIRQAVQRLEESNPSLSSSFVNSVACLLQNELFRPDHQFDSCRRAIVLENGELYWENEQWTLKAHRRDSYRTTILPVTYDPKAPAPRFACFLEEIFRNDPDKAQKKILLCEAIGYSLLSTCEYEKFFLLIGPGANGKSVVMDMLAAMVGPRHVCAVQPAQFDNRFQRAHMQGKLVNLVTEIAEGHEIADAELKGIVSGELTTAEHKLKPPFDFHPFATCWFGTNHMPHTRDFSQALFRRALILTFNRVFAEHEQDKHLKDKLKAELPGILNIALEAVAGVFKRGGFTSPPSSEEAKQEWRMESDQAAQFVEDCCEWMPHESETSANLYKKYTEWALEAGIRRTLSRKSFTQRIVRLGGQVMKGRMGNSIAGITLKQEVS
jgi:putative DNA primase/helicase